MSIDLNRRRFTVDEYHRMGEAGILAEHEPVELIAGEIVVREPIGSRHAGTVNRLTRLWTSRLGDRAIVQIQNPIELPKEDSEPQPDVTVLRPRPVPRGPAIPAERAASAMPARQAAPGWARWVRRTRACTSWTTLRSSVISTSWCSTSQRLTVESHPNRRRRWGTTLRPR